MSEKTTDPLAFIRIDEFKTPAMPAEELFQRYLGRLLGLVRRDKSKPFIAADQLRKATADRLNEVVAPPACGPLLAKLDRTISLWSAEGPAASLLKLIVLPPAIKTMSSALGPRSQT